MLWRHLSCAFSILSQCVCASACAFRNRYAAAAVCVYRTNDPQVGIAGSFDKLVHFSKLFFDIKITYGVEEQNLNTVTKANTSHAKQSKAKNKKKKPEGGRMWREEKTFQNINIRTSYLSMTRGQDCKGVFK